MAANRKGDHGSQNRRKESCQKTNLYRVSKSVTDFWGTARVLPVIKGETLPYKVALAGIVERKGESVGNWNEEVGESYKHIDTN